MNSFLVDNNKHKENGMNKNVVATIGLNRYKDADKNWW